MNGPQHYRAAEYLLNAASGDEPRPNAILAAQVHATLALAAASAEQIGARGPGDLSFDWHAVVWPQGGAA